MIYQREQLIGHWFRQESKANGDILSEHAVFNIDGSFEFTFTTADRKGEVRSQVTELGDWGLVGDIHFTVTKNEIIDEQLYAADLADKNNYQVYRVESLGAGIFRYCHYLSGEQFQLKKISEQPAYC